MLQEEETGEEPKAKRKRVTEDESTKGKEISDSSRTRKSIVVNNTVLPRRIDTGCFSKVPPELFHHILKFLSSEVPHK